MWDEPYTANIPKSTLPMMDLSGKGSFGRSSMWFQQPRQMSWHARLSEARGAHYLKFGGEGRYHHADVLFPYPLYFSFGPSFTADGAIGPNTKLYGDSWATFLLGAIDSSSYAQYRDWQNVNSHYYAAYI